MKYFIEWLKSFSLGFNITSKIFHLNLLIFSFFIGIECCTFVYAVSLRFPKYAFVLSSGEHFFYKNKSYWFFRKKINKYIKFYVLHVIGDSATQIKGKENEFVE